MSLGVIRRRAVRRARCGARCEADILRTVCGQFAAVALRAGAANHFHRDGRVVGLDHVIHLLLVGGDVPVRRVRQQEAAGQHLRADLVDLRLFVENLGLVREADHVGVIRVLRVQVDLVDVPFQRAGRVGRIAQQVVRPVGIARRPIIRAVRPSQLLDAVGIRRLRDGNDAVVPGVLLGDAACQREESQRASGHQGVFLHGRGLQIEVLLGIAERLVPANPAIEVIERVGDIIVAEGLASDHVATIRRREPVLLLLAEERVARQRQRKRVRREVPRQTLVWRVAPACCDRGGKRLVVEGERPVVGRQQEAAEFGVDRLLADHVELECVPAARRGAQQRAPIALSVSGIGIDNRCEFLGHGYFGFCVVSECAKADRMVRLCSD